MLTLIGKDYRLPVRIAHVAGAEEDLSMLWAALMELRMLWTMNVSQRRAAKFVVVGSDGVTV